MNWSDERYVRVYTRDTTSWLMWSWQARALFVLLLRKADRRGVIDLAGHGKRGIVAHVSMPWEVAGPALEELLVDGCLVYREERNETSTDRNATSVRFRNYIAAQEAVASPRLRQQAWRERRRDDSSTGSDAASPNVDEVRRDETRGDSYPCRTVPNQPSGSGARVRARDQVQGPVSEPEVAAAGSSLPVQPAPRAPEPRWQPRTTPAYTGGVVLGSVPNRANRCASCGGTRPPFVEDQGRQLCLSCRYPKQAEEAPTQ